MADYSGDAKSLAKLARDQCEAIASCIDTGDLQGAESYLNSALNNPECAELVEPFEGDMCAECEEAG